MIIFIAATLFILRGGLAGELPFTSEQSIRYDSARAVDACDINSDGYPDLLSCRTTSSNNIACWLSVDGSGTNWQKHTVWTNTTSCARTADVDGDGDLDVIAVSAGEAEVMWHENRDGTGTNWQRHLVDGAFSGANDIRSADIDRDGKTDVTASASDADEVAWWRNVDGAGTNWNKYTVLTNFEVALSVCVADMDRDGDPDIVAGARNIDTITWCENTDGTGASWNRHDVVTNFNYVQCVGVADLDNDGDPDIVASGQDPDIIRYWRNVDGSATNWQQAYVDSSATDPSSIYLVDLDRDGDIDVLSGERGAGDNLMWHENRWNEGSSGFYDHTVDAYYTDPYMVLADDINGDGNIDYLAAGFMENNVSWFFNVSMNKSAIFPVKHTISTDNDVYVCAVGDVDGDGDIDIAGGNYSVYPNVNWWKNLDGRGQTWTNHMIVNFFSSPRGIAITDLNQDGRNDFIAAARGGDKITWWSNPDRNGTNLVSHEVASSYGGPEDVVVADMDHDGDRDVLTAGYFSNTVTWWENTDRTGTNWIQHDVDNMRTVHGTDAADVNGDGFTDIIGISYVYQTNIVWWQNMDGTGLSWTKHDIEESFSSGWRVRGADMDGDGDMDVAAISYGGNTIAWWENQDGSGTGWTRHDIDTDFALARSFALLDADADGDLDVAVAGYGTNEVSWWENTNGLATGWHKHIIVAHYTGASSVAVADINLDGLPDLVTSTYAANDLSWWENRAGQYIMETAPLAPDQMPVNSTSVVLKITFRNIGRGLNTNYQDWATLVLQGTDTNQGTLLEAQFEDLLAEFALYIDNGDGTFDPATDTNLQTWTSFNVDDADGTASFNLPLGQRSLWVAPGTSKTYFATVTLSPEAHTAWPDTFVLSHVTGPGGSLVQDYLYDTPMQCYDGDTIPCGTGIQAYAQGDVGITKTASTNNYCGGEITWSFHITNRAQPAAVSLVITDTLPAGVTGITSALPVSLPGMVLYLHLDESPLTGAVTVADASGNGHHGTVQYPWSFDLSVPGKYGGAIDNRDQACISLGNPAGMNFMGEMTMAAWIRPDNTNGGTILAHGYNRISEPEVYLGYFVNRYYAGTWSNGVSYASVTAPEDIVGQWTHLAGVYDGSHWRIYHNGQLIRSTVADLGAIMLDEPWTVGAAGNTTHTSSYFRGDIDEVVIFNRALSGRELHDMYSMTHPLGSFTGAAILTGPAGGLPAGQSAVLSCRTAVSTNLTGSVTNRVSLYSDGLHFRDTNALNQSAEATALIPDDYDRDGMFDPWEWQEHFSPTNPADAPIDSDGDEASNLEEYIADTDPWEITSYFHIEVVSNRPAREVWFDSSAQREYTLQYSGDLVEGTWSNVPGQTQQAGSGNLFSLSDTNTAAQSRSYRVHVEVP
jgi:uncharacterized repeat protein (TIGR01451 family)